MTITAQKKTRLAALAALAIAIALVGFYATASAQGTVDVTLDPTPAITFVGDDIEVDVVVGDNVVGLYTASFQLTYDSTIVQVQDADDSDEEVRIAPGPLLAAEIPGTPGSDFLVAENTVVIEGESDTGTITFTITLLNPAPAVSEGGILATITFRGQSLGQSNLTLTSVLLSDIDGVEIDSDPTDGTIDVASGVDVGIEKSGAPNPVIAGEDLTYTLTVTSNGSLGATGVTATDVLPVGTTFVSAVPSQGSCSESAGTVTCPIGDLASGESATVTIVVSIASSVTVESFSNTATVTRNETDEVTSNDSDTIETLIDTRADLSITKTASTDTIRVGQDLTYTLAVSNTGPSDATDVLVTDTLPATLDYVSATASQGTCTEDEGVVTCELGTIVDGGSATVSLVVTGTTVGEVANKVILSSGVSDLSDANNSDMATTTFDPEATPTPVPTNTPTPTHTPTPTNTPTITPTPTPTATPIPVTSIPVSGDSLDTGTQIVDLTDIRPSLGEVEIAITAEFATSPDADAALEVRIVPGASLNPATQRGFELIAENTQTQINDIAYSIEVVKTGLPDEEVVRSSEIRMCVGPGWFSNQGGAGGIFRIYRIDDDGNRQSLIPTIVDPNADPVCFVVETDGLSIFALLALAEEPEPLPTPVVFTTDGSTVRLSPTAKSILTSPDGRVTITVPIGAVPTTLDLNISEPTLVPDPVQEHILLVEPQFVLTVLADGVPQPNFVFSRSVDIALNFTDADLDAADVKAQDLRATWHNAAIGQWQRISGSLDPATKTVSAFFRRPGLYSLSGLTPPPIIVEGTSTPFTGVDATSTPDTPSVGDAQPPFGLLLALAAGGLLLVLFGVRHLRHDETDPAIP